MYIFNYLHKYDPLERNIAKVKYLLRLNVLCLKFGKGNE